MLFKQEVAEIRRYFVTYTVEADSLEEAKTMLENGETISEEETSCDGVIGRFPQDDIQEV